MNCSSLKDCITEQFMSMAFPGTHLKKCGASAAIGIQPSIFLQMKRCQTQETTSTKGKPQTIKGLGGV